MDSGPVDKFVRAMALLVLEILSICSADEGVDEKAQLRVVSASCRHFLRYRWVDFALHCGRKVTFNPQKSPAPALGSRYA